MPPRKNSGRQHYNSSTPECLFLDYTNIAYPLLFLWSKNVLSCIVTYLWVGDAEFSHSMVDILCLLGRDAQKLDGALSESVNLSVGAANAKSYIE
jgi:hypothetical protein